MSLSVSTGSFSLNWQYLGISLSQLLPYTHVSCDHTGTRDFSPNLAVSRFLRRRSSVLIWSRRISPPRVCSIPPCFQSTDRASRRHRRRPRPALDIASPSPMSGCMLSSSESGCTSMANGFIREKCRVAERKSGPLINLMIFGTESFNAQE